MCVFVTLHLIYVVFLNFLSLQEEQHNNLLSLYLEHCCCVVSFMSQVIIYHMLNIQVKLLLWVFCGGVAGTWGCLAAPGSCRWTCACRPERKGKEQTEPCDRWGSLTGQPCCTAAGGRGGGSVCVPAVTVFIYLHYWTANNWKTSLCELLKVSWLCKSTSYLFTQMERNHTVVFSVEDQHRTGDVIDTEQRQIQTVTFRDLKHHCCVRLIPQNTSRSPGWSFSCSSSNSQ